MPNIHDYLTGLVGQEGIQLPETFLDDFNTAYTEEMSISGSKVETLESEKAALAQQVTQLKTQLYDAMMSVPGDGSGGDETTPDDESGEADPDAPSSIDDLFTTREN